MNEGIREGVLGNVVRGIMGSKEPASRHSPIEKSEDGGEYRKIGGQDINKNTMQVKCQRSQEKKVLRVKTAASTNEMRTEK